jgi:hypothetical protein
VLQSGLGDSKYRACPLQKDGRCRVFRAKVRPWVLSVLRVKKGEFETVDFKFGNSEISK